MVGRKEELLDKIDNSFYLSKVLIMKGYS